MSSVLPGGFLFRYELEAVRLDRAPGRKDPLPDLSHLDPLPDFRSLSQPHDSPPPVSFASVRLGWHESGLGVQVEVTGKSRPVRCLEASPDSSDGLTLWIDTRNTQTIHRASRFCHALGLLPSGGGRGGDAPVVVPCPIARARDEPPEAARGSLRIESQLLEDGYRLQAWIDSTALNGWDTDTIDAVGFTYRVRDNELGDQVLALGDEFPYDRDPSLWSVLRLAGA
jgi:hypothetical protein